MSLQNVRLVTEGYPAQGMSHSTVVLTFEPPLALLRTPSGSYEFSSEGRGVGVWSSAVAKVFCLGGPEGSGSGRRNLGP